MKKLSNLITLMVLVGLNSCSYQPSDSDALTKLNKIVNPSANSFFKYFDLKIIKKTELKRGNRTIYLVNYSAVRKANKELFERPNAIGGLEYLDTSLPPQGTIDNLPGRIIKNGQILDTLYASIELVKTNSGWQ